MIADYVKLARPKDWIKSVFVVMPVPFALAGGASLDPWIFALGVASLCLASSAVYSFNDAQDAERDRMHEKKRRRPIAAGSISRPAGYAFSASLAACAVVAALATSKPMVLVLIAVYAAANLTYSLGAKHVALLDVFFVSSYYLIRVLLGCVLLSVHASNWLLVCSSALALFIALAKRRGDVAKGMDSTHRPSLAGYNQQFLDQAMGISASLTIIAYALYTIDASRTSSVLVPGREFAGLPFVVFGVLDYLRLAHVKQEGGDPVELVSTSPMIIATGVGWLVATLWSLRWPAF